MDFDDLDNTFDDLNEDFDNFNTSSDESSNNDLDFESDTQGFAGESEIEFDESGFSLDDTNNNEENSNPELDSGNMANTNAKKTALIAIAVGFGIIILCLILANVSKSIKNKRLAESSNGNTYETTQKYNGYNKKDEKENLSTTSNNYYTASDWAEIATEQEISFNGTNKSEFTVINITNYAKVLNDNGDKIIKSVVKGYISGLVGTFEVEIPYDKAKLLNTGTILKVEYSYSMRNNNIIINEINFK